jgi:hypothetical protein
MPFHLKNYLLIEVQASPIFLLVDESTNETTLGYVCMLIVGRGPLVLEFVELTPLDLELQESLCMNLCVI